MNPEIQTLFDKFEGLEIEIIESKVKQLYIRFADSGISQPTSKDTANLRIRVISGKKQGIASINQTDLPSIEAAIIRAKEIAELSSEDPKILPLNDVHPKFEPNKGFDEETAKLDDAKHTAQVAKIIEMGKVNNLKVSGNCISDVLCTAYMNSKGVSAKDSMTRSFVSTTMQTATSGGWGYQSAWKFDEIDAENIAKTAIDKALASQNPVEISLDELQTLPVILEPAAFAEILLFLAVCGFSSLPYLEGRSFVSEKLGEQFFDEKLNISENAFNPVMSGLPFDFEGVMKQEVRLVEEGKVVGLAYDRKTALDAGVENTGHANPQPDANGPVPKNLVVATGDTSFDDMIAKAEKAILITKFHYTNLEDFKRAKITGLTRNGTFLVENGKISKPLINMRFTESLLECFKPGNILAIGDKAIASESFWGGAAFIIPAIMLKSFNFTSFTGF